HDSDPDSTNRVTIRIVTHDGRRDVRREGFARRTFMIYTCTTRCRAASPIWQRVRGRSALEGKLCMRTRLKSHFVQRVASSRLVEPSQLAQAREAVGDDENSLGQYLLGQGLLTRFQLRQLRAGARQFHVDKYIVVDFLGRGGNSIVLKARHT